MLVFSEKITVSQILKFQQQLIEAFLNSTDMSEENKESPIVPVSMDSWVEWFRSVAPHIHSIRGKTIVIDLAGETILQEHFSSLIADISTTSSKRMPSRPKRPVWPPKPKSRRSAQRPSPRRRPQPKLPPRRPSRPLPQRAQKHPLKAKPKLPPQNKRRTLLSGIPVNFPAREIYRFFSLLL